MENELSIKEVQWELDRLIERRDEWKYAAHPGMTNVQVLHHLDEMDDEIACHKALLKDLADERYDILREER